MPDVICVTPEPLAVTVNNPALRAKTSFEPSPDQSGLNPLVSGVTVPPPALMSAICVVVAEVLVNAMVWPSGLQTGSSSCCAGVLVSRVKPVPSRLIVQMSLLPTSTMHMNARRWPSGDHDGSRTELIDVLYRSRDLMQRLFVPTMGPSDWRRLLADPGKQWREAKSAYEAAVAWEAARKSPRGLPPDIASALDSHESFRGASLVIGIPEHQVNLEVRARPPACLFGALQ